MSADSGLVKQDLSSFDSSAYDSERLFDGAGTLSPGWKTTLASMVGMTLGPSVTLVFCFGVFIRPLQEEFKWGIPAISFGASIIAIMIILTSMLAGYLTDRYGARRLVLCSIPLFGASVASLYFLDTNINYFYAGLVIAALCGIGIWPVTYNKAAAGWFDKRLGLSLGLANAGVGIGAAIVPAVVAIILANYGWRASYLALGIGTVGITWPIAYLFLRDKKSTSVPGGRGQPVPGISFKEAAKTREFWLATIGFLVLGAASSGSVIHLIRILGDAGMAPSEATAMQSVLGMSLIFGRLCTGWLLDRCKVSHVMAALCLAAALGLGLLAAGAPLHTAPVSAFLIGFIIGAETDGLGYLIPRYFGRGSLGLIYGFVFSVFQLGAAIAISVFGIMRASMGSYSLALNTVAAMLVVGAVLFLQFRAYRYPVGMRPE